MPLVAINCPHTVNHGDLMVVENIITGKESFDKCSECEFDGPNLWLCLHPECRYVGCAEEQFDHSTIHNKKLPTHSVHINLSSNRIWCYFCQVEVHTTHISPNQSTYNNKLTGDSSVNIECKLDSYEHHQKLINRLVTLFFLFLFMENEMIKFSFH